MVVAIIEDGDGVIVARDEVKKDISIRDKIQFVKDFFKKENYFQGATYDFLF